MGTELIVKEDEQKALSMVDRAKALTITNNVEFLAADQFCVDLKALEKTIIDHHRDVKAKAKAAHDAACTAEKKALLPVVDARVIVKQKIGTYQDEQERIRREEEDRLEKEREAAAKAKRDKAAAAARKAGDTKLAKEIAKAPLNVAPVVLPDPTPKAQTVVRKVWTFRVTDPLEVPREYLMLDEVKIGGVVRSMKGMTKISGVEAYEKNV